MAEKMRLHILAKELNVPSKTIIEKCKAEGIDTVKNHMSRLSTGLSATIREWFGEAEPPSVRADPAPPVETKTLSVVFDADVDSEEIVGLASALAGLYTGLTDGDELIIRSGKLPMSVGELV